MARHHPPFIDEEISFFAALVPVAWLLTIMLGGQLFDRMRRKATRRVLLPVPD